ncbi:MAG TPA: GNAT family N-acetyltransferase [Candidatus Binatia bacterium]|jgi:GNAT superfamily N-acetyltransferase
MSTQPNIPGFQIRAASAAEVPVILSFIKKLAAYEKLSHEVVATDALVRETLFGARPTAEVAIGYLEDKPVGFVLFFHNYSTFLGRPGIYIEDLFVEENFRRRGYGRALLLYVARLAKERRCGRLEWSVLDWNEPAIRFYKKLGALPMSEWTVFRVTGDSLDELGGG